MSPVHNEYKKLAALALKLHKRPKSTASLSDAVAELAVIEAFAADPPGDGPFAAAAPETLPKMQQLQESPVEGTAASPAVSTTVTQVLDSEAFTPHAAPSTPSRSLLLPKMLMPNITCEAPRSVRVAAASGEAGPSSSPLPAAASAGHLEQAPQPTNPQAAPYAVSALPTGQVDAGLHAATGTAGVSLQPFLAHTAAAQATDVCPAAPCQPHTADLQGDVVHVDSEAEEPADFVWPGAGTEHSPPASDRAPSEEQAATLPNMGLPADDVENPFLDRALCEDVGSPGLPEATAPAQGGCTADPPGSGVKACNASAGREVEPVGKGDAGVAVAEFVAALPTSTESTMAALDTSKPLKMSVVAGNQRKRPCDEAETACMPSKKKGKVTSHRGSLVRFPPLTTSSSGLPNAQQSAATDRMHTPETAHQAVDGGEETPDNTLQKIGQRKMDTVAAVQHSSTTSTSAGITSVTRGKVSMAAREVDVQQASVQNGSRMQTRPGWRSQRKRSTISHAAYL